MKKIFKLLSQLISVIFVFGMLWLIIPNQLWVMLMRASGTEASTLYTDLSFYSPDEPPFYTPAAGSSFVPVNNFKGLSTSWGDNSFLITGERLLFAGYFHGLDQTPHDSFRDFNVELLCVDIRSGKVLWQDWIRSPNLTLDENQAILYAPSTSKGTPENLLAYQVSSGKKLWETRFPSNFWNTYNAIGTVIPMGSELFVTNSKGHGTSSSYILNKSDGAIKQAFEGEDRYSTYGERVVDGVFLKPSYSSSGYGNIRASALGSGEVLWVFSEFVVSNIAVDGSTVYFVNNQAQLIAVNVYSGAVLDRLQFTPTFESTFEFLNDKPIVAAGGGYVAVYFGDKKQLSVFQFPGGQ